MTDDYPYRNKLYSDDDRIHKFKQLKEYNLPIIRRPSDLTIKPKSNIIMPDIFFLYKMKDLYYMPNKSGGGDYQITMLSDLFNDICRSKCGFGRNLSPFEYYNKNKHLLVSALEKQNLEVNDFNIREEIYYQTIECSAHNPGIIKKFIEFYDAKKILDVSCGWGDRLLGSMAANNGIELYEGTDPNTCLHPNFQNMIKLFRPLTKNQNATYKLTCSGFETYEIKNDDYYDLLYTSPPYFDYEKYTSEGTQSHKLFNTEDMWYKNFLQVAILKCIKALRYGGHMVLYFSQEKGKTYMEKFFEWMKYKPEIYYLGCINYSNQTFIKTHPVFIYKKTKQIPSSLYNPKLSIEEYKNNNTYNVIKDNYIIGGTYTRGFVSYIGKILNDGNIKQLIYTGMITGYEQACIAYSLYLLKKPDVKLILVFRHVTNDEINKIKKLVLFYHPNTEYVFRRESNERENIVESYNDKSNFVIPKNFRDNGFKTELSKSLSKYIDKLVDIKRLWLVVPSDTLLDVLLNLLPNTEFNVVIINKFKHNLANNSGHKINIYTSSYNLYDRYKEIGYNTTLMSDGKVWEFIGDKGMGVDGDFIWNTNGAHHYMNL